MDSFTQRKLNACKTIKELNRFVIENIPTKTSYQKKFRSWWSHAIDPMNIKKIEYNDAFIKIWNFMLQQENPVYLGKTSDHCKTNLGSIHGMECSGH